MRSIGNALHGNSLLLSVAILVCLAVQGCTVAGYIGGSQLDKRNDRTIYKPTCAQYDSLRGTTVRLTLRDGPDVQGRLTGDGCCTSGMVRLEMAGGPGERYTEAIAMNRVQAVLVRQGKNTGICTLVGFCADLTVWLLIMAYLEAGSAVE